jgi:hypothetical protein
MIDSSEMNVSVDGYQSDWGGEDAVVIISNLMKHP